MILGIFSNDLAIDLGTANTCVYVKGKGIVLREPSVVAVKKDNRGNNQVLAVVPKPSAMLGRAPRQHSRHPPHEGRRHCRLRGDGSHAAVFYFQGSQSASSRASAHHDLRAHGITQVEKRAVKESALSAGAREVFLIEEPMAAAIGANLPIQEPTANMVVDIGGGTTEVAVISLSGIVYSRSVRVGGDKMDEAILRHVKRKYNMLIGESTAEESRFRSPPPIPWKRKRKSRSRVAISSRASRRPSSSPRKKCARHRRAGGRHCAGRASGPRTDPARTRRRRRGTRIVLTGGGALLRGLDQLLREDTSLPIFSVDDPLATVVMGTGIALDNMRTMREVCID